MARRKGNVIMNTETQELTETKRPNMVGVRFREVEFKSMAEKIANDRLFYKNYYYPGGREIFAEKGTRYKTVDKFFPYAEGGPLFVDEVSRTEDENIFKEKTEKMKTLGHRYVAILPGMTELDIRERLT